MPTGCGCVHMDGVGHEHLIVAMELFTSSGSAGLIRETLHPGKLRINLAHHFQVTAYVTQIPSLQSGCGILEYQRPVVTLLEETRNYPASVGICLKYYVLFGHTGWSKSGN